MQLNLNKLKTRGTLTDYTEIMADDHVKTTEERIADTLVEEKLSLPQVRRTINSLATKLYRPPWK